MELTITLADHLATELTHRAAARQQSPEEFVEQLLGIALRQLDNDDAWRQKNCRRLELIRNSMTGPLEATEQAELDQLQAEADRRMETVDNQLLEEQQWVRQAVV